MFTSLVKPLSDGPIDIVGDVHGEIGALHSLLTHLGYDSEGDHPQGRRLVFVGDLTDRGPDSPAVVKLVKDLIDHGRAQCVLGNHELNILLNLTKHDNHWFFGRDSPPGGPRPAVLLNTQAERLAVVDFFGSLPVALEREDLRVVHACWDDEMIAVVRNASDVVTLHNQFAAKIEASHRNDPPGKTDPRRLEEQNSNPVKVLTSGKERHTEKAFIASGKERRELRVKWWESYAADPFCAFGHYSLYRDEREAFCNALCIDYAVAKRWEERLQANFHGQHHGMLAALQWPERVVVFEDGDRELVNGLT